MAMVVITGLQGSGKSHQAMKYIILPNFIAGRIIRTNIKGINIEAIIEYCKKHYPKVKEDEYGKIIPITDKDINDKNFYPVLLEVDNKEVMDDTKSIIKSGEVVVIDEAAQFYGTITDEQLVFFTMHRHFTDTNGLSSEICLLVQDIQLLHTKVRKLTKTTYQCRKLDMLGFSSRYFLGIYDGGSIRKSHMINSRNESYDKEMFKLYNSHSVGKGKEQKLDKRANIFMTPKAWILISAVIIAPIFLFWSMWKFLHPEQKSSNPTASKGSTTTNQNQVTNAPIQNNYKIVGILDIKYKRLIFLQDTQKNIKTVYPSFCTGNGITMKCKLEDSTEISYFGQGQKYENKTINNVIDNSINK